MHTDSNISLVVFMVTHIAGLFRLFYMAAKVRRCITIDLDITIAMSDRRQAGSNCSRKAIQCAPSNEQGQYYTGKAGMEGKYSARREKPKETSESNTR